MSMAVYEPANGARAWVALMQPAADLAAAVAGTDFVPKQMRNNAPAIAACILYGDEIGLNPMFSLSKIAIIDGKPAIAAEAMRALIFHAGHELWFEEHTVSKVTVAGRRKGSQQVSSATWTLDDARRANLAGKPNWRMYPRAMLVARATAELARNIFADVIGGLAAIEELEGEVAQADEASTAPASAPSSRRRRRPSARDVTVAASPKPEPPEPDEEPGPPLPGEPGYDPDTEDTAARQTATTRRLHAQFRERGMTRDERLGWASASLGRKITSFNELSQTEADELSAALAADPTSYDQPAGTPPLTSSQFRTAVDAAEIGRDIVAEVGTDLHPRKSLDQLTDEQRGQLFDAIKTRSEETGWQ